MWATIGVYFRSVPIRGFTERTIHRGW